MNTTILNKFPKKLSEDQVIKYLQKCNVDFNNPMKNSGIYFDLYSNAYLLLNVTRENQFRLSYAIYGYEGIEAYFPFSEKQLYNISNIDKSVYVDPFDGGFIGDDIDVLIDKMNNWLKENNYE